jgi:hypothetical protein
VSETSELSDLSARLVAQRLWNWTLLGKSKPPYEGDVTLMLMRLARCLKQCSERQPTVCCERCGTKDLGGKSSLTLTRRHEIEALCVGCQAVYFPEYPTVCALTVALECSPSRQDVRHACAWADNNLQPLCLTASRWTLPAPPYKIPR